MVKAYIFVRGIRRGGVYKRDIDTSKMQIGNKVHKEIDVFVTISLPIQQFQ